MKNLFVSRRSQRLIASPIRKFLPLVAKIKSRGIKVFELNVGDPDIQMPKDLSRDIKKYNSPNMPYAPSPGIPIHVESWVKYYKELGIKLLSRNIIPTQGAAEGILMSLMAVTDPGDEVIVFEPLYTSYKGFASLCDIKLKPVTLKIENNFLLPPIKEVIKQVNSKTKAIVIINPDNPTGKLWSDKELRALIAVARKNNLFIISDETYRGIVFKGKAETILSYKSARKNLIVLDSLSKRFSAPGIRIGAVVSYNDEIMKAILKIAMIRLSASTVGQLSTVRILKNSKKYIDKLKKEYAKRSLVVSKELKQVTGVQASKPEGAFYQVVKLPIKNSEDFVKFLITNFKYKNQTVLVTPMEDFYITKGLGKNEIRLAYVLNIADLKEAILVLKKGLEAYLEKHK